MPLRLQTSLVAIALASAMGTAVAQTAPMSHVASPGIYRVLQENNDLRVVLATWKPGERDEMHSHPANVTYALTACHVRLYGADGKPIGESRRPQGSALIQSVITAHSLENMGTNDCQILIVERK